MNITLTPGLSQRGAGMTARELPGPVGVELTGLDLNRPLAPEMLSTLSLLAARRGVLVFPGQALSAQAQLDFSAQFGPLEEFGEQGHHGNPERRIFRVSNQGDGYNVGHYWHMDGAPRPRPTAISTLQAVEVPDAPLTHTRFAHAGAAWAALPAEWQARLLGRHWSLATRVDVAIARSHPVTAEPMLTLPLRFPASWADEAELRAALTHLNRDIRPRVLGLSEGESEAWLTALVRHLSGNPGWVYSHPWRPGDLLLWDQRTVYHHAEASAARRVLHRSAVKGTASPAWQPLRARHREPREAICA